MTYLEEAAKRAALIGKTFEQPAAEKPETVSVPSRRARYRYAYVAVIVYLAACAVLGFVMVGQ